MRHNVARLAMLLAMLGIDPLPMPDPPKEPSKPTPRRAWALLGARRDRVAWAARMTEACMRGLPVAMRVLRLRTAAAGTGGGS